MQDRDSGFSQGPVFFFILCLLAGQAVVIAAVVLDGKLQGGEVNVRLYALNPGPVFGVAKLELEIVIDRLLWKGGPPFFLAGRAVAEAGRSAATNSGLPFQVRMIRALPPGQLLRFGEVILRSPLVFFVVPFCLHGGKLRGQIVLRAGKTMAAVGAWGLVGGPGVWRGPPAVAMDAAPPVGPVGLGKDLVRGNAVPLPVKFCGDERILCLQAVHGGIQEPPGTVGTLLGFVVDPPPGRLRPLVFRFFFAGPVAVLLGAEADVLGTKAVGAVVPLAERCFMAVLPAPIPKR